MFLQLSVFSRISEFLVVRKNGSFLGCSYLRNFFSFLRCVSLYVLLNFINFDMLLLSMFVSINL